MTADSKMPDPERSLTDESLRTERSNTDRAIAERRSAGEDEADAIVRRARDHADAVLGEARDKADEDLVDRGATASRFDDLAQGRAVADKVLRDERATEDAALLWEREEQHRILRALLPLERAKTDRHLLTERIRSDDALANRDDFLSIVSHDLRNLLSGIVMSASALSDDADHGLSARATTDRIQRYAARMNRLIGDLEDVGSIDGGRLAILPKNEDLTAVIIEALETFQDAAAAKSISLEGERLERPCTADFDEGRILQVLANLIANALKFTPPNGMIRVCCEQVDGAIQVSVRDTGSGIPEDMIEKIFERFRQAAKDDRRGLGLGLYISRGIIQAHGGTLWAESELGQGSRFCFTLPAAR